jgi:hypothetical protein
MQTAKVLLPCASVVGMSGAPDFADVHPGCELPYGRAGATSTGADYFRREIGT